MFIWYFRGYEISDTNIGNQETDLQGVLIRYCIFLCINLINIGSKFYYIRRLSIAITIFIISFPIIYRSGNINASLIIFLIIQAGLALIFLLIELFIYNKNKQQ